MCVCVCVCVQGCAGEPGGEDEYVERSPSFRIIYGCQEVSVCVCVWERGISFQYLLRPICECVKY